jgi:hypothetical protein
MKAFYGNWKSFKARKASISRIECSLMHPLMLKHETLMTRCDSMIQRNLKHNLCAAWSLRLAFVSNANSGAQLGDFASSERFARRRKGFRSTTEFSVLETMQEKTFLHEIKKPLRQLKAKTC